MEPQSAAREGENRWSKRMSNMQSTRLEKAYHGLMMNIIIRVPTRPNAAVYQVKYLNEGLKQYIHLKKVT